jgi:arsenate reductase-like glutaredoxin family protein
MISSLPVISIVMMVYHMSRCLDCDKALEVIRRAGVSAALFAPGW